MKSNEPVVSLIVVGAVGLPYWLKQCEPSSYLNNVMKLEVLRRWSLSEVLRLTLQNGRTIIAKISKGEMSNELDIINDILIPANIDIPTIFESFRTEVGNIMIMEDLGLRTVEKEPEPHHFIEAARQLARIHLLVRDPIDKIENFQHHFVPKEQYFEDIGYLAADSRLADYKELLRRVPRVMKQNLDFLYQNCPITITHNDYHAKNLIIKAKRIMPIDWSLAYLSPHLGDLYCITQEALDYNVSATEMIDAYSEICPEIDDSPSGTEIYQWQLDLGALCWEIHTLRWIVEFGLDAIEEAEEWIPASAVSIRDIMARTQASS